MEIANSQVGQDIAQNTGKNAAVAPRVDNSSLLSAGSEEKKDASALKNVQVNPSLADKEDSERQQQDVETAAREIEAFLQVQARNLSFSTDKETQRSVVTVRDSETGDVIRQIPSEEVLRLAERIKELQEDVGSSVGVLLNNRV